MGLGLGLGMGIGGGVGAAPGAANPQLLLWSEEMQQATWVKPGATVTADFGLDPDGQMTADRVVFDSFGTINQTTGTAATTGADAGVAHFVTTTLQRFYASGTFDGVTYYLSVYAKTASGTADFVLTLRRSGGFLQVEAQDLGDGVTIQFSWWKLETPTLTDYVKREGT